MQFICLTEYQATIQKGSGEDLAARVSRNCTPQSNSLSRNDLAYMKTWICDEILCLLEASETLIREWKRMINSLNRFSAPAPF